MNQPVHAHRKWGIRRQDRSGVAMVEFAVCLPVIAVFVLGTIELASAIFVQQSLTSAAYEAVNVASAIGGTASNAEQSAKQVLTALGIKNATVTITPSVHSLTPMGTLITVTCSAPYSANAVAFGILSNNTLTATIRMTRS